MPAARRIAAAVLPDAAKRAHERWATRRRAEALEGPTRAYVERHGTEVRRGPLAGLRYPPGAQDTGTDYLVAKLAGTYELELHDAIAEWIAAGLPRVIDVGCAEGSYAVGLALAMPASTVHAYDIDPTARERCAALAKLNGVAERVRIGEACTPETLQTLPDHGVALLVDAEGYELELLDPARAPKLAGWPILVELHDFIDPAITDTIVERFTPTHDVLLIEERPRDGAEIPELAGFSPRERAVLLDEYRPEQMRWAYMQPAR